MSVIRIYDTKRNWRDSRLVRICDEVTSHLNPVVIEVTENQPEAQLGERLIQDIGHDGGKVLYFVHSSDISASDWDKVLELLVKLDREIVVYSTEPFQSKQLKARFRRLARGRLNNPEKECMVWYEESVPYDRSPVDEFVSVIRVWASGRSISEAFLEARSQSGIDDRDEIVASRLLLDCSILLVRPQHEAFARVSEEVRQVAARPRDASFWVSYWDPVKEFLKASLATPPNLNALKVPEKEKNALAECLRYVAERLSTGEGRPDPDAQCIKNYLAERFSA